MLESINWLYAGSGFGVGFLVGMTGVGGGALMTPVLILLFGIAPTTAVGTDLLYASITKSGGSLIHAWYRTIDWKLVGRLAQGSVPAAIVTLLTLYFLKVHGGAANILVTKVLSVALLITAITLFFRNWLLRAYAMRVGALSHSATVRFTVLIGLALGALVSLTSVGAGALVVAPLILLYPEMPIPRVVGSNIAHAVPLTMVGGLGHWLQGNIDTALLLSLLIGSLPGIFIGSYFVTRVPEPVLRILLGVVLVLVSAKFLLS